MNATFVNGTPLETGVPLQIHSGDKLRFGVVELQFELP
jgi:pSer/pThr/pTyr-binding forkhead associated (FHA) protein